MRNHLIQPNAAHQAIYDEINSVLLKHSTNLSALEILAITSQIVGKVLAMQDQRTTTPESAMRTVEENITLGNRQMIEQLNSPRGNA